MIWRCLSVLCILLMCMPSESSSFPLGQRGSLTFSHSLHLTRTVRSRVQKLLTQYVRAYFSFPQIDHWKICFFLIMLLYWLFPIPFWQKQQMFGDELFEYREIMLSTLPAVTVSYQIWLQMQVCLHFSFDCWIVCTFTSDKIQIGDALLCRKVWACTWQRFYFPTYIYKKNAYLLQI